MSEFILNLEDLIGNDLFLDSNILQELLSLI